MSVINQMLQELEQRRVDAGATAAQVRAVSGRQRRKSARWLVLVFLGGVVAAASGYWIYGRQDVKTPAPPPLQTASPQPVAQPQPEKIPQVLQLADELGQVPVAVEAPPLPVPRAQVRDKPISTPEVEDLPKPVTEKTKTAKAFEPVQASEIGKDIKQTSPQQRAENVYRLAYASLQQGHVSEAEESLRLALKYDPRHAASRQALAVLLVEAKNLGRAEQLLQQGLELLPGNTGFAMTLARLQVERGDAGTALATLQRNPPNGENAEYHGFMAALLQRGERHKEAIEQYLIALHSNPGAGPWLLGLGLSLQADNQPAKAAEVFRRAKSTPTLSPELRAFAEQRLRQVE